MKKKIFEPITLRHVHMFNSDHPWCMTKWLFMGGGSLKEKTIKCKLKLN